MYSRLIKYRFDRLGLVSTLLAMLVVYMPVTGAQSQILPTLGGERAGTSGYQFLKIPVDARSAALGETAVATAFDVSALFWNPALLASLEGIQIGFFHTAYFVDINLEFAAVSYRIPGSGFSVGGSLQTLNSGEMEVTTEFQPFGTGETFRLTDFAIGITVAQSVTDLFNYGITTKYVRESVAGISTSTVVFDMGIFYRVGTTGAQMAVSVRNFGLDANPKGSITRTAIEDDPVIVEDNFDSITPPTTFHLGFAYEVMKSSPDNTVQISAQLNNPSDNSENWAVGVEYGWHEIISLRLGYRFGIEEFTTPSAGIGIRIPDLGPDFRFDYSFNRLERLGAIHRIGINLGL